MLQDVFNLPLQKLSFAVLFIIGCLAPGHLLIYLYLPDLFVSIESIKLIIFSVSIALPVYVVNIFASVVGFSFFDDTIDPVGTDLIYAVASLSSFISFYSALLLVYFFTLKFKIFLAALFVFIILFNMILVVLFKPDKKKNI